MSFENMTRITYDGNTASNSLPPYPEAFHSVWDICAPTSLARTSSMLSPGSDSANCRMAETKGLRSVGACWLAQEQTAATIATDSAESIRFFIDALTMHITGGGPMTFDMKEGWNPAVQCMCRVSCHRRVS